MTRNVRLTLTGIQYDEAGEQTVTEMSCAAEYYFKNESHYIFYEETAEDTGAITKNAIKFKGSTLEQHKRGAVNSHMIFEQGREHITQYATPLGSLTLGILTQRTEIISEESEISFSAEYHLTAQGNPISRNTVIVKIVACTD